MTTIKHNCGKRHFLQASTKAEQKALEMIQQNQQTEHYRICQQVRNMFPLPAGANYIPDFILIYPDGLMRVIECKGGYKGPGWEQGIERYNRAAQLYDSSMCRFEKWTWLKNNMTIEIWGD